MLAPHPHVYILIVFCGWKDLLSLFEKYSYKKIVLGD